MENTSASTDEHIRATFDMLTERISNIEEHIERQNRTEVFAECCKYGRLNNKTLGLPFKIARHAPSYSQTTYTDPSPSMRAILVSISTSPKGCRRCYNLPSAVEVVLGKDFAQKVFAGKDHIHPSEVGWMDSRFCCVDHAAIQQYINSIFEGSGFKVTFYSCEEIGLFSISSLDGEKDLSVLLEPIPKLLLPISHEIGCITDVVVEELPSEIEELVQTIQKAEHLPEGAREVYEEKLDAYPRSKLHALLDHDIWGTLPELYLYLDDYL